MPHIATNRLRPILGIVTAGLLWCSPGCGAEESVLIEAAPPSEAAPDVPSRGLELGSFDVSEYHPIEGKKSTLRFTLHATVAEPQSDRVAAIVANREHKLRDEVITAVRTVPTNELDSPSLTELRRRILLRLKRHMPELSIQKLHISDFQLEMD